MGSRSLPVRWLDSLWMVMGLIAAAQSASAEFHVTSYTIDGGGITRSTGGSFALGGTIGQPDAGVHSGGMFALNGGFWFGGGAVVTAVGDDILDGTGLLPASLPFRMYLPRPNPVTERTVIAFDLPQPSVVRAALYDVSGRLVRVLADEPLPAGRHQRIWDRRDRSGRLVSSGIYFLRLEAGVHQSRQKIVVVS